MRFFGSAATPLPAAAALGDAAPVHLRGVCAAMPGSPVGADLWRCRTIDGPGGRSVVEEAEDFVVADPAGARAVVLVEGGRLVNATTLRPGDLASIFGFLDATSDRAGLVREPHGRTGAVLALRSGADHPLLVSVIERYA